MDMLKKVFPFSFGIKDLSDLIVKLILMVAAGIVISWIVGVVNLIPIVNILTGLVGGLAGLYVLASIVLAVLDYFKILK